MSNLNFNLEGEIGKLDLWPEEGGAAEAGNPFRSFQLAGNQNLTRISCRLEDKSKTNLKTN